MSELLLEACSLVKHFPSRGGRARDQRPVRAVDGVGLTVRRRETVGLVGESGSGKSTVGRLLLRLLEPTSGEVRFQGLNLASASPSELRKARRDMQMIFQDPFASLDPRMRAADIVAEPLLVQGLARKREAREQAVAMLERVGLDSFLADRYPHEFSGGQRQRIAIARALATRPKFVVCDEPVSALDLSVRAQIVNLLFDLQEEYGLAYILIAHDLDLVCRVSDRVAVMYLGKIVELTSAEALVGNARHPYSKALLAAVPKVGLHSLPEVLEGEPPSAVDIPPGCRFHPRCPIAKAVCSQLEPELAGPSQEHVAACHFAWD